MIIFIRVLIVLLVLGKPVLIDNIISGCTDVVMHQEITIIYYYIINRIYFVIN